MDYSAREWTMYVTRYFLAGTTSASAGAGLIAWSIGLGALGVFGAMLLVSGLCFALAAIQAD